MNVASKELCQELYELSGWDDTHWMYGAKGLKPRTVLFGSKPTPAYTLGYLMRKLPQGTSLSKLIPDKYMPHKSAWTCKRQRGRGFDGSYVTGDTPENTACSLAIELFKSGVLSKEKDHE